jgi:hypothetical protein
MCGWLIGGATLMLSAEKPTKGFKVSSKIIQLASQAGVIVHICILLQAYYFGQWIESSE